MLCEAVCFMIKLISYDSHKMELPNYMNKNSKKTETIEKKEPVISLLIKAEPGKKSYRRTIKKTIGALDAAASKGAGIEVLLVGEKPEDIGDDSSRDRSAANVRSVLKTDIRDEVAGRYIMKFASGDTVEEASFIKLIEYIDKTDRGVYTVPWIRKEKVGSKAAKAENDEWITIFGADYEALLDTHCVAFRADLIDDPGDLLEKDLRATGALIKAVLASGGYERIGKKDIVLSGYTSSVDTSLISEVVDDLVSFSKEKYGCVEDFLQESLLTLFMAQLEKKGSKESVKKHICHVSDEVIVRRKQLVPRKRLYLLNIKHGKDVLRDSVIEDYGIIRFGNTQIANLRDIRVRIDVTEVENGTITFEGRTDIHLLGEGFCIYMLSSEGDKYDINVRPFPPFDEEGYDGEPYYKGMMFSVKAPVGDDISYRIYLENAEGTKFLLEPSFSKYSKFMAYIPVKTVTLGGYFISFSGCTFRIRKTTKALERKAEINVLKYLAGRRKYAVAIYRILVALDKFFSPKPVWIVADRPHIANDNGEHMFRYIQTTDEIKRSNVYFLIKKDSKDYPRLRKTGKVLNYGSYRHKIKFLRSEVILCAAANDLVINAMGKDGIYYRDLLKYDFVYLRHGVSHNDQSGWINKLGKNIRILVSTCRPEYEGILKGDYDYTEREVRLTGLPRFDNLYDEKKKEILILPTWRKNLQGDMEEHSSEREYVGTFVDSDYCKFYNALINDERLLEVMERYGYTGTFYLHPVFEKQYGDFHSSRLIKVGQGIADYQELFRRSAIMVTDYSSVAFDFAYLKKPVVYAQFDEAEFYKNHSWGKGYFTYREDGFGPITNTVKDTVDELIYNIENDCKMRDEYVEKVERFFAYTDRNNCKRVYDAVREIERR